MLWRQGDVFISVAEQIPEDAVPRQSGMLVEGELTGHSHRLEETAGTLIYGSGDDIYLDVTTEQARLIHEEHGPITLPRGRYRVWRQREYVSSPKLPRRDDAMLYRSSSSLAGESRWVVD